MVVIGSGLIGLSVASAVAARGAAVTVLEREARVGGLATRASFAWVNARPRRPASYDALGRVGLDLYLAGAGDGFHRSGATLDGVVDPDEGWLDTAAVTDSHLRVLAASSAVVRVSTEVRSIGTGSIEPVVTTTVGERIAADLVVLAAGVGCGPLVRDLPAAERVGDAAGAPGFLARVPNPGAALAGWEHGVLASDRLNVRPDGDGGVALQSLPLERELLSPGQPAPVAAIEARLRELVRDELGVDLPADARFDISAAQRPHARDGLPAVGWLAPETYLVLTHSGVTLAPMLAGLVADELGGTTHSELEPFRPDPPTSDTKDADAC